MKVKDKDTLNINGIMKFLDHEVNRFTEYISIVYTGKETVIYETKDQSDFLLFEFLELSSVIRNLNECLDGITVDDIEIHDFEIIFKLK